MCGAKAAAAARSVLPAPADDPVLNARGVRGGGGAICRMGAAGADAGARLLLLVLAASASASDAGGAQSSDRF